MDAFAEFSPGYSKLKRVSGHVHQTVLYIFIESRGQFRSNWFSNRHSAVGHGQAGQLNSRQFKEQLEEMNSNVLRSLIKNILKSSWPSQWNLWALSSCKIDRV